MALLNQSVQVSAQLPAIFERIRGGQAPDKFSREFLRDLGFKSSNHHAVIPLLKGLGFLTPDGTPTPRYKEFLDKTKSGKVLAEALSEAYGDIFVLKRNPTKADKNQIAGKFKSTYNLSDIQADRSAATFLALLSLADEKTLQTDKINSTTALALDEIAKNTPEAPEKMQAPPFSKATGMELHYNIQIHLPATKDIEVYNSIFKALRVHLLD
jgi:hypothetical protein